MRSRFLLALWMMILWLPASYLLTRDLPATQWNLFTYHLGQWAGASLIRQLAEIALYRLPLIFSGYSSHLALITTTVVVTLVSAPVARRIGPLGLMIASLGLFAVSHLSNGDWHIEYLVPCAAAAIPLVAIGVAQCWDRSKEMNTRWALGGLLAATMVTSLIQNFPANLDVKSSQLPIQEIRAAATVVQVHTTAQDKIMALEATSIALEARRELLPGLTLAYFSLQPLSDETAQELHVVTSSMIKAELETEAAKVVILTEHDWELLAQQGDKAAIERALQQHYDEIWTQPDFGQWSQGITMYLCRNCP